jgi:DNA modification methylase
MEKRILYNIELTEDLKEKFDLLITSSPYKVSKKAILEKAVEVGLNQLYEELQRRIKGMEE